MRPLRFISLVFIGCVLCALPCIPAFAQEELAPTQQGAPPDVLRPGAAAAKPDEDTLTHALVLAYQHHPQLEAARAQLKATDEQVNQAFSGFLPSLNAEYDEGRTRNRSGNANWTEGFNRSRSLDLSQPLYRGGRTVASLEQSEQNVKATRAQLLQLEQQVLLDAISAYCDVAETYSVQQLATHNMSVLNKQLEAEEARFSLGANTRTDLAQAQARAARAQADLHQADADLESARANYIRVINESPMHTSLPAVPVNTPQTVEEALQIGTESAPLLHAAAAQEKAAEANVDVNAGSILPSVSLDGSLTRTDSPSRLGIFSGDSDQDSIALRVRIPLYQSGAEYSRVRQATHLREQAKFNQQDILAATQSEIRRAYDDFKAANAVSTAQSKAVEAATTALEGVRAEHDQGLRTTLDVLDAEQELFTNRVALVHAQRQQVVQAYRLMSSIGKLTANDLQLPVDMFDPDSHYNKIKYRLIGF